MEVDTILVPRAAFSIDEPWTIPAAGTPVELRRATDGGPTRLRTRVTLYFDDEHLTIVFVGEDDGVVATHLGHDMPLYQEDVVEVFLSPFDRTTYYEIEVNPLGTTFDARIHSPDGVRATMQTDLRWTCDNLFAAVRRTPASWETVLRIPFASLATPPATTDDVWRVNLYRIDRNGPAGDEFSAWRPTMKNPPDFHVAAAFGRLQFT